MSKREMISAAKFLTVYIPAAKAGKSAAEIAAELYGVAVDKVEKKQVANVTQTSTRLRREFVKDGKPEDYVPFLKRGRVAGSTNKDELFALVDALSKADETPEVPEAPETPETPVS